MFKHISKKIISFILVLLCIFNLISASVASVLADVKININTDIFKVIDKEYPTVEGYNTIVITANYWLSANIYAWKKETLSEHSAWPGIPMRFGFVNEYGQYQYFAFIPVEYDSCVISNTSLSQQTVDIDIAGNMGVYLSNYSNGLWTVGNWSPDFYDTNDLKIPPKDHDGKYVDIWPGERMNLLENTDNIYYFDIPIEYNYFIFSDGNYYLGFDDKLAWQTDDILFTGGNKLYKPNLSDTAFDINHTFCSVNCSEYTSPIDDNYTRRVYFEAPSSWDHPSCYCWSSGIELENPVIRYGADRFSFGECITGWLGEEMCTLLVYDSKEYDISDLKIKSSNPDIVEIKIVVEGSDMIIPSNSEKVAEVVLDFKGIGSSTIVITSPEGYCERVMVTVEETNIENFDIYTYVANDWLNESTWSYSFIQDLMYNFEDPCYSFTHLLEQDKDFLLDVAVWESANIINDPTLTSDKLIDVQQYYESILLSLIYTQMNDESFEDYIKTTQVSLTNEFVESFIKIAGEVDNIDFYGDTSKVLTDVQKTNLLEAVQSADVSLVSDLSFSLGTINNIMKASHSIDEFYDICSKHLTLLEIKDSIVDLLDAMCSLCENSILKEAIYDVKIDCNNQLNIFLSTIEAGTVQMLELTADAMLELTWAAVLQGNVAGTCLKAGFCIGSELSNILFSTDEIIEQYYSMRCLNDVRTLINLSVEKLKHRYQTTGNSRDAKTFITAVGFLFDSFMLSCNYSLDFQKITHEDSLVGQIMYKNDTDYIYFKNHINNVKENLSLCYDTLIRVWCYGLKETHPNLFETLSKRIDLLFYWNVEHSSVRIENLSFEFTGEEIKPRVYITMNGKELVLDKDFSVSYNNNEQPGMANIVITGIGEYNGVKIVKFSIKEPWYSKKVDIRNNGYILLEPFSTKVASTSSNKYSAIDSINIEVYDGNAIVAAIKNGVLLKSDIHMMAYGDRVTLFLDDKDYKIVVYAEQNRMVNYSYSEYDNKHNLIKTTNYNDALLTATSSLIQTTNNDIVLLNNDALLPSYESIGEDNKVHTIEVRGGTISSDKACNGEWVYIGAYAPIGYEFVEWKSSNKIVFEDKFKERTCFTMADTDIEIEAVFKKVQINISGTITSYGGNTDSITIKLMDGEIEVGRIETNNNFYIFEDVQIGTYKMEVSKNGHITETYEVIVDDESIIQNVDLYLVGDTDGDGRVNIMDATEIQRHITQLSTIPEDRLSCADANRDGQVNIMDATQIQLFIAQLIPEL